MKIYFKGFVEISDEEIDISRRLSLGIAGVFPSCGNYALHVFKTKAGIKGIIWRLIAAIRKRFVTRHGDYHTLLDKIRKDQK